MAIVGYGATVAFTTSGGGTSGFTGSLVGISGPNITRKSIQVTHMASPGRAHEFLPGMIDYGEFTMTIFFDPDTDPPVTTPSNTTETVTITWPVPAGLTNGATWAAQAFIQSYNVGSPLDERCEVEVGIKISGVPTYTNAS